MTTNTPDMNGPTVELAKSNLLGQTFGGKYRILSEISQGGMGKIYKAEQIALKRAVAIKVIVADDDPIANKRFLLEASLTANLDHPNIVKIYDFGRTQEGVLFLVMEMLQGENLEDWVKHYGPLSAEEALSVGSQLCGALAESHSKKVVHRDIKPANIIISRRTGMGLTAKLIDFGLVKNVDGGGGLSRTGMVVGTPMYMAPEQLSATGVDDRVDIYALGLTMFYALTGRVPYPDRGLNSLMLAQLNEDLDAVSELNDAIDGEHLINWVVSTAIAKDPKNRFQNALQFEQSFRVCEQRLPSGEFPQLQITDGVLSSDQELAALDPNTPSTPLVDPEAYVKDGSAISNDFADALSASGMFDAGLMTVQDTSQSSLEFPSAAQLPVSGSASKSKLVPALVVLALVGAVAVWFNGQSQTREAPIITKAETVEIEVNSVPEGADVFLDGTLVGSTPFGIQVESGESTHVELRMQGHETRKVALSSRTPSVTIRLIEKETVAEKKEAVEVPVAPKVRAVSPAKKSRPARAKVAPKKVVPPPPAKTDKSEGPRDPWAD